MISNLPAEGRRSRNLATILVAAPLLVSLTGAPAWHSRVAKAAGNRSIAGQPAPTAEMPKPYSAMTGNDLHDYLGSLHWGGKANTRPRTCKWALKCPIPALPSVFSTDVFIQPELGAKEVGRKTPTSDIDLSGTNGFIVARLINQGGTTEAWLGLEAGDTAYWVIEPASGGKALSHFIVIHEPKPKAYVATTLLTDAFRSCQHSSDFPLEADFDNCKHRGLLETGNTGASSARVADYSVDVKSTWISCVAGCCSTESGTRLCNGVPCAENNKSGGTSKPGT